MNKINIKQKVILDEILKDDLLSVMGLIEDSDGYLVFSATKERALTSNGKNIKKNDFGGFIKGSTILLRSDIDSVFQMVEQTDDSIITPAQQ